MKKILILLFAVFLHNFVYAQTGGANGTGGTDQSQGQPPRQTTPSIQNPYSQNPYSQNPYNDPNSKTNFLKDARREEDNQNKNIPNSKNKENLSKELSPEMFRDMNSKGQDIERQILIQKYKDDPEYLKFLGIDPSDDSDASKEDLFKDQKERDDVQIGKKQVYGSNFFKSNAFELSDRSPVAPPLDYRLGPGDEILVSVWGAAEHQQNYIISRDGSIFPRLIGKIYLQGMTLDNATRTIASRFKKVIPSNSQVEVQMGKSRTIKVTVLGEVLRGGTYTISAFNTALNALFIAGGLTDIGNMRRIEVKRYGRTVEVIDLYKYLKSGKNAEEVYLEDNDYIYVDVYDKLVNASGLFKRPMYYQLTADEGLRDLIEFSGGPSFNARNSLIHVKTVSNEEEKYIDIPGKQIFDTYNKASYLDLPLKDGDVVSIKSINEGLKNVVSIEGSVAYPDDYELRPNEKLFDIIKKAGGLTPDAFTPRAFIMRGSNSLESDAIKVDLNNLEHSTDPNNIPIMFGDKIKVLSNNDFNQDYFIDVIGSVRNPSKIKFVNNLKLKDVLLMSGGLTLDAENGRIEISNVVDSLDKFNINSKGNNIKIISINSNLEIDEISENIILKPLDRVYVRKKVEFVEIETILINGEVKFPGEYTLLNKSERISSILKRAGGVKNTAFTSGAKLYRKDIGPIVIDLPEILKSKNVNKHDIILKNGDMLFVPTINDIVSVRGEVQSEVNIKFANNLTKVDNYIAAAGGYGESPWKNRIYVKHQNGKIKSTKHFLFIRKYPKVSQGSTVFVPTKPPRENNIKFSEIFGYTLSTLTTVTTLIVLSRSLSK